jgi:hypothetical protein
MRRRVNVFVHRRLRPDNGRAKFGLHVWAVRPLAFSRLAEG